eukprot:CAMPEP_0172306652 /NCGR_PEP_ID=MMETSP1058-20130122/7684_1 /TAXON_ID=83371 /ORGANISM="Detonula confervacea, Strain CCMP 353" /LENGTH=606 /DNA_ID=CAMNT_0013018613 /DNA_START=50 /DNA_END=1870 /DNA_ORIENTATION=-
MKTTHHQMAFPSPSRGVAKTVLLLALLIFAAAAPAVARADDVADESKPKKKIPLVGGILDKVKIKKMKKDPTPEVDDTAEMEEPVCKSDGGDDANCSDDSKDGLSEPTATVDDDGPSDDAMATTTEEEQQQPSPEQDELYVGPPKENYFMCKNLSEECEHWSHLTLLGWGGKSGTGCEINSAYMSQHCPLECGTCENVYLGFRLSNMLEGGLAVIPFCQDNDFNCRQYADMGECDNNSEYMSMFCEASCQVCSEESNQFGVGQRLFKEDPTRMKLVQEGVEKSTRYMRTVIRDRKYRNVRKDCLNKNPDCTLWAAQGECENNKEFMTTQCGPACMSCDALGDTSETCHGLPESAGPLWKPGSLNTFFEEVVDNADGKGEYYRKFNPRALSRPKQKSDGSAAFDVDEDGPWVVLLENFLTDEEADRMIQIGHLQGYERSVRTIGQGESDVTDGRTSGNTWCQEPSCMEDLLVAKVLERIATTTKSTIKHSEHVQLLRYEAGQFYDQHHDFIPYQLDLPCGARIMTLFLYLNDVEEGGNTSFPDIGVSVKPKKGSALLWPSVLDQDPLEKDPRMDHMAEAVVEGVKYGANAWIHSEDFQTPFALKCMS